MTTKTTTTTANNHCDELLFFLVINLSVIFFLSLHNISHFAYDYMVIVSLWTWLHAYIYIFFSSICFLFFCLQHLSILIVIYHTFQVYLLISRIQHRFQQTQINKYNCICELVSLAERCIGINNFLISISSDTLNWTVRWNTLVNYNVT